MFFPDRSLARRACQLRRPFDWEYQGQAWGRQKPAYIFRGHFGVDSKAVKGFKSGEECVYRDMRVAAGA